MVAVETWGHTCIWETCGHQALILDPEHPLDHPHWCPICEPDREGCGVEYLDAH